jgi:hypothetical protein
MKKLVSSIILGLALSVIPAAVYAACADLITIGGNMHCVLTGSSTSPSGHDICYYKCTKVPAAEVELQD